MSNKARKEYLTAIQERYRKADRAEKGRILDEFAKVCGYHRKYAIRVLSGARPANLTGRRGRKATYPNTLIPHIRFLWLSMGQLAAKRMVSALPEWLMFYERTDTGIALTEDHRASLLKMSASTLNRFFDVIRPTLKGKGISTTRPNFFLKNKIPIAALDKKITKPGFVQGDTVAHCGNSAVGNFANTITVTDIYSTWTETRAMWTKEAAQVKEALRNIDHALPFDMISLHTDCGSEFLNYQVLRYLQYYRRKKVALTRSRPYKKNDNAYVEQKNNTHVRQLFGYDRIGNATFVSKMNEIYRDYWNPLQNYFLPSMKLTEKTRIGGRITKKYDKPKTAYQRILESPDISKDRKAALRKKYKTLNPFLLKQELDKKLDQFFVALEGQNQRAVA